MCFCTPTNLMRIEDPSPPIQFGLYRLLVALVTDAFRVREQERLGRFIRSWFFRS